MDLQDVPAVVAGRYRLRNVVGTGGMGTVWRATDELLGRDVAIKRVRLDGLSPADAAVARERTMREARIAAALHHPHIVSIFDVVLEGGEPWLILEFVPSRTLGSVLDERGALPPAEVAAIGAQVAAALATAHAAGIVHRDVKPDNVLLAPPTPGPAGPQLNVKLTDFGIAHAATAPAITATEILTGTPAYFAPETARGEGTDTRTDVYSLGATLYAAVEGHPPFGTDPGNVLALLTRIGRGQAPPPRHAGHLTDLLRHLTADDPADRPTAAQAHAALLHAASPPPAFIAAALDQPGRKRRRGRLVAAVVGVLAVVAAGITAVVLAPGGEVATGAAPTSATRVAGPRAVVIDDPLTADPCSLLDTSALAVHGTVEIDRDNGIFAGCRADISRPDRGPVIFNVTFRNPDDAAKRGGAAQETIGSRAVYRFPASDDFCERRIMLSDGNAVDVNATSGGGAAGTGDLCDIAETGTRAAVDAMADGIIGARTPVDRATTLGGTKACSLLRPDELAIVPGLGEPTPGFADWECTWTDGAPTSTDVYVYYHLGGPLGEADGTPTDFAGRPARVLAVEGGCWVQFMQRNYTAEAGPRVETVSLMVHGPGDVTALCGTATTLAGAAASKLPPPS
jgi:eukaryotic-like serine/threonine-protein kinase